MIKIPLPKFLKRFNLIQQYNALQRQIAVQDKWVKTWQRSDDPHKIVKAEKYLAKAMEEKYRIEKELDRLDDK